MSAHLPLLYAFLAMVALDFVWVFYTRSVVKKAEFRAALWAGGITLLNGISVLLYANDWRTIPPAVLGAAVGTWLAMKYGHGKETEAQAA